MQHTDKVPGLKAKAKALEDSFFAEENARLLQRLREAAAQEEKKKEFRAVLAVKNEELLDALIELGVEAETLVAISLVPFVEVAWADGEMQAKERAAILKAAEEQGVKAGTATHDLLENWLATKPDDQLLVIWGDYVQELVHSLGGEAGSQLKASTLGRARAVAEAAMLEKLEWAFD
jgi:hypothetical protein